MYCVLEPGATLPTRAHKTDAGLDLYCRENFTIKPYGRHTVDTGVHLAIPTGMAGYIVPRSGLNVKKHVVAAGLIDAGYTGSIIVKLYNLGPEPVEITAGDRIAQIVIHPIAYLDPVEVPKLPGTERGAFGFGSTGK